MSQYDNTGQVALWGKKPEDSEKAPDAKGHFYAHRDIKKGEKVQVALWRNESDNPKAPKMKGKVSDAQHQQNNDGYTPPADDSDIPF